MLRAGAFALAVLLASCGSPDEQSVPTPEEAFSETRPPTHWTTLGSGANAPRLVSGFREAENPSWRWTEPKFQLYLDPIQQAEKNYLALQFAIADQHLEQTKVVKVTAFVESEQVGAAEFESAGRHEISLEVPSRLTQNKAHVAIEFQVEPPLAVDQSDQLGLIGVGAGFRDYHSTLDLRAAQRKKAEQAYARIVEQTGQTIPSADRDRMQRLFHDLDIWRSMWFNGVELIKNPLDLWMAQQIIFEVEPDYIIETGTFKGGSALYWAHTLEGMRFHDSRVLTVDIMNHLVDAPIDPLWDEYVEFFLGSSTADSIVSEIASRVTGKRTIVFLDSDHRAHHVKRELELYAPLVSPGSYIVVEDTHIDALGTQPAIEAGPLAAVEEFLASEAGKDFERDVSREAFVLTFNPGGWLKRRVN